MWRSGPWRSVGQDGRMVTRVEAETFIRFQLDQLGAQNRHHDFENICF
jgi:hypothetical protein